MVFPRGNGGEGEQRGNKFSGEDFNYISIAEVTYCAKPR